MAAQRIYTTSNAAMMWTRSSRRQTECRRMVRLLVHARAKSIAASSTRSQWRGGLFCEYCMYIWDIRALIRIAERYVHRTMA